MFHFPPFSSSCCCCTITKLHSSPWLLFPSQLIGNCRTRRGAPLKWCRCSRLGPSSSVQNVGACFAIRHFCLSPIQYFFLVLLLRRELIQETSSSQEGCSLEMILKSVDGKLDVGKFLLPSTTSFRYLLYFSFSSPSNRVLIFSTQR